PYFVPTRRSSDLELVEAFSFEQVSKSGAKFDFEKTKWFQHHYFQEADNHQIVNDFAKILDKKGYQPAVEFIEKVVETVKERATFVEDLWDLSNFFFEAPQTFDKKGQKKGWKKETPEIIRDVRSILSKTEIFSR